jgi:hypothetical protein
MSRPYDSDQLPRQGLSSHGLKDIEGPSLDDNEQSLFDREPT